MEDEEKGGVAIPMTNKGFENSIKQEGEKTKQYISALIVTLGAFSAGTVLSWTSAAFPMLRDNSTNILDEPINASQEGWVGSLLAIGALIGAFPAGILAEKIGRKWTIVGLAVPFIISWIIIIASNTIAGLYVARIFAGIATGGICVTAPLYIGETAEASIRGALGSFFQLLLTIGILYSYVLGSTVNYQWLGILCGLIPVVFLIIFFFMPETPVYLLKKDKRQEAEKVLQWLRGKNYDIKPEKAAIQEELDEAANNKASFKDLISSKANVNALIVSLGLMIFQQLSGVNAVIFYASDIFEAAGTGLDASISTVIVGVVQVIVTYAATLLVDRAGRRLLLLISSSVMCICLVVLGVYFHVKEGGSDVSSIGWIPLISVNIFIVCFSLGFGPLPWMMMSELFSTSIKGLASGLAVTLNWALVFLVTRTFTDLTAAVTIAGAFWIFGSITAVGFLFVFFKVPETKGKTLAEIQKILSGN